jgi:myxalamid-type polyketide synthase MxaE and MxaD
MSPGENDPTTLSPLKRALLAVQEMREKLEAVERSAKEPIAITGMACRFPGGADSPEAFWSLLREGRSGVREVPADRWSLDELYDPSTSAPGKVSTRWAGFIDRVDQFDPAAFEIAPREAAYMDPQQRLMLEVAFEALENSGLPPRRLGGSKAGVYVGVHNQSSDYLLLQCQRPAALDTYSGTGTSHNVLAGRVSYLLDLRGPSLVVDTGCSSSLVALYLALQSLRSRECDLAIVGGVNLLLAPYSTMYMSRASLMSPTGACRTFDATADGFVRGEGAGALVLKRLGDAQAHGDPVLAVVRGAAVNQDGRSNGLTAPSGTAQQEVIRQALANAGIPPDRISYVEAHGTGTTLGDPIEIEALVKTVGKRVDGAGRCLVGSVKTNIGHLEGAAGLAGVMKVVLAMQHQAVPPHLNFTRLNPHISLADSRLEIPTTLCPWPAGTGRCAGVSGFAWSGTNAHVILEEAPRTPDRREVGAAAEVRTAEKPLILPLSAQSESGVRALAAAYGGRMAEVNAVQDMADLCFSAATRRDHLDHRLAIVARAPSELREILGAASRGEAMPGLFSGRSEGRSRRLVFVFPGQGSQWVGMGKKLMATEPAFKDALVRCDHAIRQHASWSLIEELEADESRSRLKEIDVVQPVLFAVEVALAELWRHRGVKPDAVVGHSMGEVAAACVAGALSLEDGARIICRRSHLLRRVSGRGGMLLVERSWDDALALLRGHEDRVAIGVSNSPRSTVLSGATEALTEIAARLEREGTFCRWVKVDIASHGPQMDPLTDDLLEALAGLAPHPARIPFYSTVLDRYLEGTELTGPYWVKNLRDPVRFAAAVQKLVHEEHDRFVEISPHPILLPAIEEGLRALDHPGRAVPSLRRNEDELQTLAGALAALYADGHPIDWAQIYPAATGRFVQIPTYPWQRERCWIDGPPDRAGGARQRQAGAHPLLGAPFTTSLQPDSWFWENELEAGAPPYLADHRVQEAVLVPAAGYLEMALASAREVFGSGACTLEDVVFHEALAFPEGGSWIVQTALAEEGPGVASFRVSSRRDGPGGTARPTWLLHASGRIRVSREEAPGEAPGHERPEAIRARCGAEVAGPAYYDTLAERGLTYGPSFQGLQQVWQREGEALGRLRPVEADVHRIHPALLDAGFQVLVTAVAGGQGGAGGGPVVPVGIERFHLHDWPAAEVWSHARARPADQGGSGALVGDVTMLDGSGRVLVEVSGLRLQQLERREGEPDDAGVYLVPEWQPAQPLPVPAPAPGRQPQRWLLLAGPNDLAGALQSLLEAHGDSVVRAADNSPEALDALLRGASGGSAPCAGVIHLRGLDSGPGDVARVCGGVAHVVQALAQGGWRDPPRLWLITRGAQATGEGGPPVAVAQAPLWGLGRTIAYEHPELRCTRVDLDPAGFPTEAESLVAELLAAGAEEEIAFRSGGRYLGRLVRRAPARVEGARAAPTEEKGRFRGDGSYLITGGLGGLGLSVARWMVAEGARHLALVGRQGAATAAQAEAVSALEAAGAEVLVARANVADRAQLAAVLQDVQRRMPPLRGVIHAAGVLDDGLLLQQDAARFQRVMAPKIDGAWNLHELTREASLDFFVLYSSAASLLGSPGQSNYAAANAFLDGLAHHRRSLGLPALSINWGAFSEVGLAAAQEIRGERLAHRGMRSMTPQEGTALLGHLLGTGAIQVGAVALEARQWIEFYPQVASSQRLSPLLQSAGRKQPAKGGGALRTALLAVAAPERRAMMEQIVREQLAGVLRLSASRIESKAPFKTLGIDSLMSLELRNRLESGLGLTLSATLFWTYPHVAALAEYLIGKLEDRPRPEDGGPKTPPAETDDLPAQEEALAGLSDEQLALLVSGGLTGQGDEP